MTYEKTIKRLEGRIRILENHIKMAKKGKIQEDCISCREQDLIEFKAELRYLKGLKEANELLKEANVSFKKTMLRQSELLAILKRYLHCWKSHIGKLCVGLNERDKYDELGVSKVDYEDWSEWAVELPAGEYKAIKRWMEEK